MKHRRKTNPCLSFSLAIVFLLGFFSTGVKAQDGESIFKSKCGACHSIGNGKFVGPDLKGVTEKRKEAWLIKFIKASQSFVAQDADAKAIFSEYNIVMPDQNLSDDEIKSVLTYITTKSNPPVAVAPKEGEASVAEVKEEVLPDKSLTASPATILLGKQLFEGSVAFKNGGASCQSCHNVNYPELLKGGVLAKDLSNAHSRLGGDAGLAGIIGAPPFPAMTVAFKDKPITPEEIDALVAFMAKADKIQGSQHENSGAQLLTGAITVFSILLCLIWLLWINKKSGMVKQLIYDRQTKTIKQF